MENLFSTSALVMILALGFIREASVSASSESRKWEYSPPLSPRVWFHTFSHCGEIAQSPVDFETDMFVINSSLGFFNRSIFDKPPGAMTYKNIGHTVQVDLEDGYVIDDPSILSGVFKAAQFHLHWGGTDMKGSEHTVDGVRSFGELHIVHFNQKYDGVEVAASQSDGLAVCGFFIEDDYPQDNLDFERILTPLSQNAVNYENDVKELEHVFSLESLLPHNLDVYYRYQGSLTTPPCYESVAWTVFQNPIRISKKQSSILQSLVFKTIREQIPILPLTNNYRPVQPLNGRIVSVPPNCL